MLALGFQMNMNFDFTQYKTLHLSISLALADMSVPSPSIHLPSFMSGLMKRRSKKGEICPSETSLNQRDVFTPELRWACRPQFSGRQPRLLLCRAEEDRAFELSTLLTHRNTQSMPTADRGGNLHLGTTVADSTSACSVQSEGEVRVIYCQVLQSIHQSINEMNHLALKTMRGERLLFGLVRTSKRICTRMHKHTYTQVFVYNTHRRPRSFY